MEEIGEDSDEDGEGGGIEEETEKENTWDLDDGTELDEDQEVNDQPREFMIVAQECEEKTEDVIVPI